MEGRGLDWGLETPLQEGGAASCQATCPQAQVGEMMARTFTWPTAEAVGRATAWPWQLVCNHGDEAVTMETMGMGLQQEDGAGPQG